MLVTFASSETGSFVMFADAARPLLKTLGKTCSAKGVITKPEMQPAIAALQRYLENAVATPDNRPEAKQEQQDEEQEQPALSRPVSAASRAWPLIDMLTRSAKSKKESHIVWSAAADFEA
jgi:hypothetical protein